MNLFSLSSEEWDVAKIMTTGIDPVIIIECSFLSYYSSYIATSLQFVVE